MFEVLDSPQHTPHVSSDSHTEATVSPKLLSLTSKLESIALTETGTFLPTATVATVESTPARNLLRRSMSADINDSNEKVSQSECNSSGKIGVKEDQGDDGSCERLLRQESDTQSESSHGAPNQILRPRSVKESTELFEVLDKSQIVSPRTIVVSHNDFAAARVHDYTSKFQQGAANETVIIVPTARIATVGAKPTNDIVRMSSNHDRSPNGTRQVQGVGNEANNNVLVPGITNHL